jgi:hypothetical protein
MTLLACAPSIHRIPGPLAGVGRDPGSEWVIAAKPARAEKRPRPDKPAAGPAPTAIAEAATAFVGAKALLVDGERYRWDCSGLVEASLASAGCAFKGSSAMLFDQAKEERVLHRRRIPTPGDIAFFDDTHDRNGNGRLDDPLSHVAVVESVAADGTITMVHVGSKGVVRLTMNLRHPEDRTDAAGKVLNDNLRARGKNDSPRTRYLTGELWVAFASYWDSAGAKRQAAVQVPSADRSTR